MAVVSHDADADADADAVAVAAALVRGHLVSLSIRAAVELDVFEALQNGPGSSGSQEYGYVPLEALAARVGLEPGPLGRLLSVLNDVGLVAPADSLGGRRPSQGPDWQRQEFRLTRAGATFVDGHPSRFRDLVLMRTERPVLDSWQRLADALRTDAAVFETVNGVDYWSHLAQHPEQEAQFNRAMARRGIEQADALVTAGALAGTRSLVDVGGGEGAMVAELVRRNPDLSGLVADRPEVTAAANAAFSRQGLSARASAAPADFFVAVPAGADTYTLSNVLHDWDDDDCRRILRTIRAAMNPGHRLWVVERHLDTDRPADARQELHLMDLHMLVMFGARERTRRDYEQLLLTCGFRDISVSTGTVWDVIGTTAG
jgi:hypothetical protein